MGHRVRPVRHARIRDGVRDRNAGRQRQQQRQQRDNQPDGSEIETARQLAKDLGVELELVQVTAPQRIPALLAGRADLIEDRI